MYELIQGALDLLLTAGKQPARPELTATG